jgi:hypothetical protein
MAPAATIRALFSSVNDNSATLLVALFSTECEADNDKSLSVDTALSLRAIANFLDRLNTSDINRGNKDTYNTNRTRIIKLVLPDIMEIAYNTVEHKAAHVHPIKLAFLQ